MQAKYDEVAPFSCGLAAVAFNSYEYNGKPIHEGWGFIDRSGAEIVPIVFGLGPYGFKPTFSEGLAAVEYNGKWGYIAINEFMPF